MFIFCLPSKKIIYRNVGYSLILLFFVHHHDIVCWEGRAGVLGASATGGPPSLEHQVTPREAFPGARGPSQWAMAQAVRSGGERGAPEWLVHPRALGSVGWTTGPWYNVLTPPHLTSPPPPPRHALRCRLSPTGTTTWHRSTRAVGGRASRARAAPLSGSRGGPRRTASATSRRLPVGTRSCSWQFGRAVRCWADRMCVYSKGLCGTCGETCFALSAVFRHCQHAVYAHGHA